MWRLRTKRSCRPQPYERSSPQSTPPLSPTLPLSPPPPSTPPLSPPPPSTPPLSPPPPSTPPLSPSLPSTPPLSLSPTLPLSSTISHAPHIQEDGGVVGVLPQQQPPPPSSQPALVVPSNNGGEFARRYLTLREKVTAFGVAIPRSDGDDGLIAAAYNVVRLEFQRVEDWQRNNNEMAGGMVETFQDFLALYTRAADALLDTNVSMLIFLIEMNAAWNSLSIEDFLHVCKTYLTHWPQYSLYERGHCFDLSSSSTSAAAGAATTRTRRHHRNRQRCYTDENADDTDDEPLFIATKVVSRVLVDRVKFELSRAELSLVEIRDILVKPLITVFLRAGLLFTCVPLLIFLSRAENYRLQCCTENMFFRCTGHTGHFVSRALEIALRLVDSGQGDSQKGFSDMEALAARRGHQLYKASNTQLHSVMAFLREERGMLERSSPLTSQLTWSSLQQNLRDFVPGNSNNLYHDIQVCEVDSTTDTVPPSASTLAASGLDSYLRRLQNLYFAYILPMIRV